MEGIGFVASLSKEHEKQLKSLRVYSKFVRNVSTLSTGIYDEYDIDRRLKDVIVSAFVWESSPEGDVFWRNICNKL